MIRKTDQFPPDPSDDALERMTKLGDAMKRSRDGREQTARDILNWRKTRWQKRQPLAPKALDPKKDG